MRFWPVLIILTWWIEAGCGTTRWSDTARTATEQMLISDSIDRAVSAFDFRALAGKKVYFDTGYLKGTIDADYVASSLRQHALASGCVVKSKADEADYIAEVRAGAVGTDRHDVLFGIPATSMPTGTPGVNAVIPELPLVKKTDQRAVAKLAIFAYNRYSGRPIWQSGITPQESKAKDIWVFGAGPFQKGDIHKEMSFAGDKFSIPVLTPGEKNDSLGKVSVAAEAYFNEPKDALDMAQREMPVTEPAKPEAGRPPAPNSTILPSSPSPTPTIPPPQQYMPPTSNQLAPVQSQGGGFSSQSSSSTSAGTVGQPAAGQSTNSVLPTFQMHSWPLGSSTSTTK